MPTRIRLQRHGKKGQPFYHIVIADSRAPRDGKFIEKLGYYNPMTNPATIELNFDSALKWLRNGAQPTETVNSILSYKGVLLYNHLLKGVEKGALTQEQADAKFKAWLEEKNKKIENKKQMLANKANALKNQKLEAEKAINEQKAKAIAAKNIVEEAPASDANSPEATTETQE